MGSLDPGGCCCARVVACLGDCLCCCACRCLGADADGVLGFRQERGIGHTLVGVASPGQPLAIVACAWVAGVEVVAGSADRCGPCCMGGAVLAPSAEQAIEVHARVCQGLAPRAQLFL